MYSYHTPLGIHLPTLFKSLSTQLHTQLTYQVEKNPNSLPLSIYFKKSCSRFVDISSVNHCKKFYGCLCQLLNFFDTSYFWCKLFKQCTINDD